MSYGIWKSHHGIMSSTAFADWKTVELFCKEHGIKIEQPKGKHWHKIEDATAIMLSKIDSFPMRLNRGIEYYKSIL